MSVNICNKYKKIGFIGAGKMASAIIGGIVKSGFAPCENIYAFDVSDKALKAVKENFGINCVDSIANLAKVADVIVIATKPFVIADVLNALEGNTCDKLVVSILAGVTTAKIENSLKDTHVIRVMPNTPAFVNEGMCALCSGSFAIDSDMDFVESMLRNIGRTIRIDEKDIDVVTALSGSGPAYYYYIIDLMAKAAHKLGLDYKTCLALSAQTALGSAKMILEDNKTPDELIVAVTTPGGCTAVGNEVLAKSDIADVIDKTIKDTMEKAKALG